MDWLKVLVTNLGLANVRWPKPKNMNAVEEKDETVEDEKEAKSKGEDDKSKREIIVLSP